jgi:hypothetical protein
MKTILFCLSFIIAHYVQGQGNPPELDKSFAAYQSAILNDKGAEAVKYLDSHSMDHFKMILEKVLGADSLAIEALSLSDKFNVLVIRHMATKKEILAFTPATMTAFAFNHGMGKSDLEGATLGKAKIKGNNAKVPLMKDGKKTDEEYEFNLEEGHWKIDITSSMAKAELEMKEMLMGQDENEFIFGMLELMSGKTPTNSIWKKIK